LVKVTKAG